MKIKLLPLLLTATFVLAACGQAASTDGTTTTNQTTPAEVQEEPPVAVSDTVDTDENFVASVITELPDSFDETLYTKEEVKARVDAIDKECTNLKAEFKNIEALTDYYDTYMQEDLGQTDLNIYSGMRFNIWDYEMDSLLARINDNNIDSLEPDQKTWEAKSKEVYDVVSQKEGSISPMVNNGIASSMLRNRCYYLASVLADKNGESFDIPERIAIGEAYYGDNGILYVDYGMEGESITVEYTNTKGETTSILAYDPVIDDTTITFEGEDTSDYETPASGKITYGWNGATLSITDSSINGLDKGDITFDNAL